MTARCFSASRCSLGLAGVTLCLVACGGRTIGGGPFSDAAPPDAARRDAAVHRDATSRDAVVSPDVAPLQDAGIDPCGCPEDRPTYQFHECVPPLQYGCEAVACTPDVTPCSAGQTCEQCAAAACCYCAACVPACVFTDPAMDPLPEYLKIWPTYGSAHVEATISIEGFPFYVGALYYLARVGASVDLYQGGGSTCSFMVTAPGQPPGMVPVWVSQYGGNEPWVLAGFFTWTSGDYPSCVQPGYPCGIDQPCCETSDVPMTCQGGRCRRL